jgi:hypothetical protein
VVIVVVSTLQTAVAVSVVRVPNPVNVRVPTAHTAAATPLMAVVMVDVALVTASCVAICVEGNTPSRFLSTVSAEVVPLAICAHIAVIAAVESAIPLDTKPAILVFDVPIFVASALVHVASGYTSISTGISPVMMIDAWRQVQDASPVVER